MNFYISRRFIISILILSLSILITGVAVSQQSLNAPKEVQPQNIDKEEINRKKGIITYVEGEARKKPVSEKSWVEAILNSAVVEGEKLKTLRRSRAELKLSQGNIIRLAERTVVDIVKLFEEEQQKSETVLNVEEGDIWANISKLDDDAKMQINTEVSVSAIRGTVLRVSVGQDSTKLKVYNGEVEIRNTAGLNSAKQKHKTDTKKLPRKLEAPVEVQGPVEVSMEEWVKIVRSMQEVVISNDRPWFWLQRNFSAEDSEEQTDWVKWNKIRDSKDEGLKSHEREKGNKQELITPIKVDEKEKEQMKK